MKPSHPYQPLLLRILHGAIGIFVIGAILTAYWTYDTYDGRWGSLSLPKFEAIEGIHGTFGLWALLIFPAFAIYAFRRGSRRLLQPDSWSKLGDVGQPIWWYTLHRGTNTFTLLALTFALFSGKMMGETWLPRGELNHGWYYAHLMSWVLMVIGLALHVLMGVRVGGAPLLLSMIDTQVREKDRPSLWAPQVKQWWAAVKPWPLRRYDAAPRLFQGLEALVLLVIVAGWLIPLLK